MAESKEKPNKKPDEPPRKEPKPDPRLVDVQPFSGETKKVMTFVRDEKNSSPSTGRGKG